MKWVERQRPHPPDHAPGGVLHHPLLELLLHCRLSLVCVVIVEVGEVFVRLLQLGLEGARGGVAIETDRAAGLQSPPH